MPLITLPSGHAVACDILPHAGNPNDIEVRYQLNNQPYNYTLFFNEYAEAYVSADGQEEETVAPQLVIEQVNEYLLSQDRKDQAVRHFMVKDTLTQSYADCNLHYIREEGSIVPDGNIDVCLLDSNKGTVVTQVSVKDDFSGCEVNPGFPDIDSRYLQMIAGEAARLRLFM